VLPVAALLVALAAAAGCAGPDRGDTTGTTPTTTSAVRSTTAADRTLSQALAAGRADGGLSFVHRIRIGSGGEAMTRTYRGRVDLTGRRWSVRLTLDGAAAGSDTDSLRVVGVGRSAYLSSTGWPSRLRGRWLRIEPSAAAEALQVGVDPTENLPAAVAAVADVDADTLRRATAGTTLTGTLPARQALGLLGLEADLGTQGVAVAELTGSARVLVTVGPDGRLRRLRVDGATFRSSPALPGTAAELVRMTSTTVAFLGWGRAGRIEEPTADDLVAADQL
jgi:hypothetical protein